jgi:large subunit ribosomal protein L21
VKRYSGENTKRGAFWEDNTMSKSFYILYNLSLLKMTSYAIVQASGKQFWIEENKFYDFDKLPLDKGDNFSINQILLVNQQSNLSIGTPYLDADFSVEATVLRHLSGPKVRVYKMRPKKKTRKTFGSRRSLTRVLINSIYKKADSGISCFM